MAEANPPPRPRRSRDVLRWIALAVGAFAFTQAEAAPSGRATFSCYTGTRVIKSDQEFIDCAGVQTRSQNGIEERILSQEQIARKEKCEKDAADALARWRVERRENENLLAKYPGPDALASQRNADLATARDAVARAEARLVELANERKRLALELEFYPKPNTVPERLQRQVDDNEALITAQQAAKKRAEEDLSRISTNFDALEKKLKALWAGKADPPPKSDCSVEKLFGPIPRR